MKILTVFTHFPVCSGRYVTDAFKRLGHDVRHIGDSTGNQIPWGGDGWIGLDPKYAYESDGGLTAHWADWTPDLVVILDSAWAYHHPVYANVPHVVYGVDNHVRDYRQAGIARYFLAHKAVNLMGDPAQQYDFEWLPCGYDPIIFTPSPIPWADREYDACLIGVAYPSRVEVVEALAKAGLKVLAGVGWVYEQYRDAYWNSRISLCVSAAGDVAQRIFETAAMGCAVLSDPLADIGSLHPHLYGYAVFKDIDSAVTQAQELLQTDGQPAEAAQKSAAPHTWGARAARIVEWWEQTYGNQETAEVPETQAQDETPAESVTDESVAAIEAPVEASAESAGDDGDSASRGSADGSVEATAETVAKPKRKKRGH